MRSEARHPGAPAAGAVCSGGGILVVDDDPAFLAGAVAALQREGFHAVGVEGAAEALEALRREPFACGVFALHLAGGEGIPLLRRSRALAPELRPVVLAERHDPLEVRTALRLGAAEIVAKPLPLPSLCAIVRRTLALAVAPARREALQATPIHGAPPGELASPPAPQPHRPPAARPATRRRVLVVDDDARVGAGIGRVLEGYDVVFAQSAAGALGRVASGHGFAAVVCDFRMPGIDGIQFHDEVYRLDPGLGRRIIYVTGWADAPEFRAFLDRTRCPCLPKPFDPDALRAAVERACAEA